ncbi:hypothetical protein B566_EDAN014130, partial [Ephemera danica]
IFTDYKCNQAHDYPNNHSYYTNAAIETKICNYANEWANHLAGKNTLQHRTTRTYGENLYAMWGSGLNVNGRTAVQSWYDEVKYYNYRSPGFSGKTGHFTQVVWKSATELGIAIVTRGNGVFVVANYSAGGNMQGQFQANVLPRGTVLPKPQQPASSNAPEKVEKKESNESSAESSKEEETKAKNETNAEFAVESFSAFELEALKAHNEFREQHGAPPLKLSRKWAKYLAGRNTLQHRTTRTYGENLYAMWGSGINVNGRTAVQSWYDEVKYYNYRSPGHFTQVVWKSTTEMGISIETRGNGVFVVANYSPHGNMQGQFQSNVFPKGTVLPKPQTTVNSESSSSDPKKDETKAVPESNSESTEDDQNKTSSESSSKPPELCSYANEWAKYLAGRNTLQHRTDRTYGENLYAMWGSGINVNGRSAVQSWYDEVKNYNHSYPVFAMNTGHFTQVVWKSTTEMGIAIMKAGNGVFVVANYSPHGNMQGQFQANVFPRGTVLPKPQITASSESNSETLKNEEKEASTESSTESSGETFSEFEIEALKAHNEFRDQHGAPPLKLSRTLCSYANEWAKYLAGRNTLQHRTDRTYGENLYAMWGSGVNVNGRTAVQSWYDEVKNYNHSYPVFGMNTGHFTQVVWKSTTEMGIAIVKAGNGVFVVANYSPHGNMQGQFQANVLPRTK